MSQPGAEPTELKAELRRSAASVRDGLAAKEPDAGSELVRYLGELPPLDLSQAVAGYAPIRSEISPEPLMGVLAATGFRTALPATPRPGKPLAFRCWKPGDALEEGPYGTRQPRADAGSCVPGLMLVPLLAFDSSCCRLGYGGGFYDRTIAGLRDAGVTVHAIGVAFDGQQVDRVPTGPLDEPLDGVLTPSGLMLPDRFRA